MSFLNRSALLASLLALQAGRSRTAPVAGRDVPAAKPSHNEPFRFPRRRDTKGPYDFEHVKRLRLIAKRSRRRNRRGAR